MRGLSVLGSTGTIGTFTLEIVERFPEKFKVVSLVAGKNVTLLKEQIRKFHPKFVSLSANEHLSALNHEFPNTKFLTGRDGVKECIEQTDVDVVVNGIVGFAGLEPALFAIRANKIVALANKESLVVAGSLIKEELQKSNATLIPVDSEHNALFQLLEGRKLEDVDTLVLTASGGPFFKTPELQFCDVTPEMAIKHPNWNMGPKISVDSATMMNKGLELIEAHFLFGFPEEKIDVWVHPQSIMHAAIWFKDNTCLSQMTKPDMKSSIGFALSYPEKLPQVIERFSFKEKHALEFFEPDEVRFPCLRLAREALRAGPGHLVVLNAANEFAVGAFLEKKIGFHQIAEFVEKKINAHHPIPIHSLDDVFELHREVHARCSI